MLLAIHGAAARVVLQRSRHDFSAEHEATLRQLEQSPPELCLLSDHIQEEKWTFSLEGAKFPTATVDVIQKGEALATFERNLLIHFQQISKAAALYVRALLSGRRRALEMYHRVDTDTNNDP